MTYEELMSLVGGSNPQSATYQDIISGIQSQYRPQTQFAPTSSLLDSMGTTVADQPRIAYGALLQAQGPRKITPIDLAKYETDLADMSGGTYDGGGGGGNDGIGASNAGNNVGFTVGPNGVAVANTVSQAAATALGLATGLPLGLAASIINAMNVSAANAANAAAASLAESATSLAVDDASISEGVSESSSNSSDSANTSGGDVSGSGIAGDNGQSGMGDGVGDGSAWYKGGIVTKNRLIGANPVGQDDGYGALQHGEYVIKKDAVNKYGEEFLGLLNAGKLTKKQINSLL
jgi:hypothetical protein